MKECKNCNVMFSIVPPMTNKRQYCTESCAEKFRSSRARDRNRAKLPPKKCLFCNEEVNRPRKYKYCKDECFKAAMNEKSKAYGKIKVRERHAKKPPIHCKCCEIQLKTTVRNHHQLEFCPPCGEAHSQEKSKKHYEENKEEQLAYFKERHAKKMQDPEYREIVRLRSIENRAKQPKTFVDCLVCGKNFQRDRYNRNCSKKCSEEWLEIKRKQPANLVRSRIAGQLRQALKKHHFDGSITELVAGLYTNDVLYNHLDKLFTQPKWYGHEWVEDSKDYSWDNMSEWHIDHIRPVASFNYTTTECEDFKKCWALNNLQPLWASDNLSKSDKWDGVVNA